MLSFECIKNEKSVYFLLTSAHQEANGIKSPREANTSPQKANGHTPFI